MTGRGPGPGWFALDWLTADASPGFAGWLAEHDVSLALSTGSRLVLVGRDRGGVARLREHAVDGPAGLAAVAAQTLYVAGRWQLHRFENAVADGDRTPDGDDRVYLPQTAYTTGFVGAHDAAIDGNGRVLFTSTLVNCVATTSTRRNFTAVWRPPFVSALVAEERCRVTGLAVDHDGDLAYVTCAAESDAPGGWRDALADGGVVVDVRAGTVLARGLALPHSPRLHRGRLYVAAAGTGELVEIDRRSGHASVVARVPGLARGLAFVGDHAVVGCSRVLADGPFARAPVSARPEVDQRSGVAVIDLTRRALDHTLWLAGGSGEVFGIAALPATVSPVATEGIGTLHEQVSIAPLPTDRGRV